MVGFPRNSDTSHASPFLFTWRLDGKSRVQIPDLQPVAEFGDCIARERRKVPWKSYMATGATVQSAKRHAKALSPVVARFHRAIVRLAECGCPVLIVGEVGAGKRTIAERIHAQSHGARTGFRETSAADCTPETLLSALSAPGTLYLNEVSGLSASLQQLIVESYSHGKDGVNARLLCGTSHELSEEVKSRRMREDFFHLVSAVTFRIPPLRLRKDELLAIADEFLTQYSKQFDRPKPVLNDEIVGFLLSHNWPGNLDELQKAIKTVVAVEDPSISLAVLKAAAPAIGITGSYRSVSLKEAARAASIEVERQLISEVLVATGGNRKRAADELGISYKALLYKIKQAAAVSQPPFCGMGVGK
jgi:two-component system, NtrC family, response regulator AtoC